ncbi:MAG: hypothetical protein QHC78_18400 [Pigmentiphaga sp.]|uniref:hypothetical protein n=1 Tax=Pigmentiphaga sp. TaxID=1977564 RepID=UPI0029AD01BD|nr:hypothetical protein [Pigmentiphaga sp.]MDX3907665.1 hypothetical protein [Pigmentiphaga sp.]
MIERRIRRHGGQAAVEALLALTVLGGLLILAAALGRLQDLTLQIGFASRHLAFVVAQDMPREEQRRVRDYFFDPDRHHWHNHDGSALVRDPGDPAIRLARAGALPAGAQLGGTEGTANALAVELLPSPQGMATGSIGVTARLAPAPAIAPWLATRPRLSSRFAILGHAGHADGDREAQDRLARAPLAWGSAAQATARAGKALLPALGRVDAAWNRPLPQFDWLSAWAGVVPADRLEGAP